MQSPALLILPLLLFAACCPAANFPLPDGDNNLVGALVVVSARPADTLIDLARHNDVGQEDILLANPGVDRWLPGAGTAVVLPLRFILPPTPYRGLVLNLPEMRLYYYPPPEAVDHARVYTYPVSIGRMDWATPLGETRLVARETDPSWRPPGSIRKEHAEAGDPLPAVVPPGPDNPLGRHALRLGLPGYLIHGTNKEFGVGMRVSHGCVRMLPEDIEELFDRVAVGMPVRIINRPVKAGWFDDKLYLEVHPLLEEDAAAGEELGEKVASVVNAALFGRLAQLDEAAIQAAIASPSGIPLVISR